MLFQSDKFVTVFYQTFGQQQCYINKMSNYICFEDDALLLFNTQNMNKLLCFKYSPFSISEIQNTRMRAPDINFNALLGIKMLGDIPYLMLAEQAEPCCNIGAATIYQIKKIQWIPIVEKQQLESALDKTEDKIREMAKLFDEGYYYFSDIYRLNTTYYFNIMNEETPDQRKFYSQFIFNENLMSLDEKCNISHWCRPIIQGYIQQFTTPLTSHRNITYTLISRRSNKKQGTRYFARGIDDKGNVANFTQTQQIISYDKFMISHIQIRGSVPAFFQQLGISGLSGELNITRNQATTQKAFQAHFSKLNSVYDRIFCVNLLSIKKSQEEKLTLFFQNLISNYAPSYVRYEYFDFHEECKSNQFQNSQLLVQKIKKVLDGFGVTVFDTKIKKLVGKQSGVVRTNCLDCLDRTNYMQSRITLRQFQKVLQNFSNPETREEIHRNQLFQNKQQFSSLILKRFNSTWADNGDKISLHYTGIGSTHTDITKVGKRTLKGTVNHKMRSLMRFFVQFTDHKKNEALQQITTNPLIKRMSSEYQGPDGQFINIVLMSFEVSQLSDDRQDINKVSVLLTEDYIQLKKPAGVVIFGYKKPEKSLLGWFKGKKPHDDIQYFADQKIAIVRKLGYEIIKKVINSNTCMLIFGNQMIVQNVTEIKNQNLGSSDNNMTVCKLYIYSSSMVFSGVNCSNFEGFKQLIQKSHDEAFQRDRLGKARSSSILQQSYRTVLGNINSGNKLSQSHIQQIKGQLQWLKKKDDGKGQMRLISEVLDNDELSNSINQNCKYTRNYMEGPAYFAPQANRIIFWNKQNLVTKVLDYSSNLEAKCVYGHFSYQIN